MLRQMLVLLAPLALLPAMSIVTASGQPLPNPEYRLGTGDKLRVKVYEWRSTVGQLQEWSALNGDYTIGPDAKISLPLTGSVAAGERTLQQLADAISDHLQKAIGFSGRPSVALEIISYRPFYLLGAVNRPGAYPYQPGITVLQAVSIAGGLLRLADPGLIRLRRDLTETAGTERTLRLRLVSLVAQRARLQAELDGKDSIAFPPELQRPSNDSAIALVMQQEQQVFTARMTALRAQQQGLNEVRRLLSEELDSLGAKITNADTEMGMLRKQLGSVTSLVNHGLAVAPREFEMRHNVVELEGRRLDLDTAILRTKEEIAKARQKAIDLQNDTRKEEIANLRTTQTEISKITAELATTQQLLRQGAAAEPELSEIAAEQGQKPVYTIMREVAGKKQRITAVEDMHIRPGDTIDVQREAYPATIAATIDGETSVSSPSPADGTVQHRDAKTVGAPQGTP